MLSNEEPGYARIARTLDSSAIKHLASFARGRDLSIATKAIYLASLLDRKDAAKIVASAAASQTAVKRIAAASGLGNLASAPKDAIARKLIRSKDLSARKLVLKSIGTDVSPRLRNSIEKLSKEDKSKDMKDLSRSVLRKITR